MSSNIYIYKLFIINYLSLILVYYTKILLFFTIINFLAVNYAHRTSVYGSSEVCVSMMRGGNELVIPLVEFRNELVRRIRQLQHATVGVAQKASHYCGFGD